MFLDLEFFELWEYNWISINLGFLVIYFFWIGFAGFKALVVETKSRRTIIEENYRKIALVALLNIRTWEYVRILYYF